MQPSERQQAIFGWIEKTNKPSKRRKALLVDAKAGSGKTTTALWGASFIPDTQTVQFVAFNVSIRETLNAKIKERGISNMKAVTYNSAGNSFITANFRRAKFDENKLNWIVKDTIKNFDHYKLRYPVQRLASLAMQELADYTDNDVLHAMALMHDLDFGGLSNYAYDYVRAVIETDLQQEYRYDYTDQNFWPYAKNLSTPYQVDFGIVDEYQDTNRAQSYIIDKLVKPNGRIMAIGDTYQTLYGFRGANMQGMSEFVANHKADTLPLDVTYRNPAKVVQLVNELFPEIPFHARPNAPDGVVQTVTPKQFNPLPSHMVLCRTNAPMVAHCLSLIRQGKTARIRGRNIGDGLKSLIKRMKSDSINELSQRLHDYFDDESARLAAREQFSLIMQLQDKIETIYALSDGCNTVQNLNERCETMFSDNIEGVTFSSVHRAKGLEAETVWVIEPQLMPHPMAKQPWQREQERNVKYVAVTRTLENLFFVEG